MFINDNSVDISGLAETWLDDTIADGYVQILKFTLILRDHLGQTGGGVCFYYKSSLAVSRRLDLEDSCLESLVISAKTRKGNPDLLTLALYYIPPSAPRNVWDTLEMSLETLCTRTPSRLAQVCELVGTLALSKLVEESDKSSIGLYCDDSLAINRNVNHPPTI